RGDGVEGLPERLREHREILGGHPGAMGLAGLAIERPRPTDHAMQGFGQWPGVDLDEPPHLLRLEPVPPCAMRGAAGGEGAAAGPAELAGHAACAEDVEELCALARDEADAIGIPRGVEDLDPSPGRRIQYRLRGRDPAARR